MPAHKHAAHMAEYAKDALETDKPWERWKCLHRNGEWKDLLAAPSWSKHYEYRRKPAWNLWRERQPTAEELDCNEEVAVPAPCCKGGWCPGPAENRPSAWQTVAFARANWTKDNAPPHPSPWRPWMVEETETPEPKPKTININGYEVPEPVRKPLSIGTKYFTPVLGPFSGFWTHTWANNKKDWNRLRCGFVHLSKEAAEIHARALSDFDILLDEKEGE